MNRSYARLVLPTTLEAPISLLVAQAFDFKHARCVLRRSRRAGDPASSHARPVPEPDPDKTSALVIREGMHRERITPTVV